MNSVDTSVEVVLESFETDRYRDTILAYFAEIGVAQQALLDKGYVSTHKCRYPYRKLPAWIKKEHVRTFDYWHPAIYLRVSEKHINCLPD